MFSKPKMSHNKPAPPLMLSQRIAEEAQLLAEEKWIIGALKKIKAQRNGLQIERLHLESMRAKILANPANPRKATTAGTSASTSNDTEMIDAIVNSVPLDAAPSSTAEVRLQNNLDDEDLCNLEELNLAVTNSVFNADPYSNVGDEEEEEDDMENCVLDIDLLMSGK